MGTLQMQHGLVRYRPGDTPGPQPESARAQATKELIKLQLIKEVKSAPRSNGTIILGFECVKIGGGLKMVVDLCESVRNQSERGTKKQHIWNLDPTEVVVFLLASLLQVCLEHKGSEFT